jgi:hypothetical protein
MKTYLDNTRFASEKIIDLFTRDVAELLEERKKLAESCGELLGWYESMKQRDVREVVRDPQFWEHLSSHVRKHSREAAERSANVHRLEAALEDKLFSISATCGSLLEIAKQGISVTYGGDWRSKCPTGRAIGATWLRDVVWEGRNHSMHYEEGKPKPGVEQCFRALELEFGPRFSLSIRPHENLSMDIVFKALSWVTYENNENDMKTLLEPIAASLLAGA